MHRPFSWWESSQGFLAGKPVCTVPNMHNAQLSPSLVAQLQSNVLARYTRVKVIIPHAGGYVPYQAERIATSGPGGLADGQQRMAQLKRLYFDTAMSGE